MSDGKRDERPNHGGSDAGKKDSGKPGPDRPGFLRSENTPGGEKEDRASGESKPVSSKRAGLTERQRREARELRRKRKRERGRSGRPSGAPVGNAISRGLKATALETGRALAFLARGVRSLLARAGSAALFLIGAILTVGATFLDGVRRLVSVVAGFLARVALGLDRVLTPARALVAAAILAGSMLAVSQFLDYRAVEIGSAGYDPILDLTRAPRTDVETPLGVHSIVLLAGAIAALGSGLGLALTGRRAFALPIVAVGFLALAIGLAIDLPRGLDSAAASAAYADARAVLLTGFWLEMASGAVLAAVGLSLVFGPATVVLGRGDRRAASGRAAGAVDRRNRRRRTTAGGTA